MAIEIKRLSEGGKVKAPAAHKSTRNANKAPPKKRQKKQQESVSHAEAIRAIGVPVSRSAAMKQLHAETTDTLNASAQGIDEMVDEATRKHQEAFDAVAAFFKTSLVLDIKADESTFTDALCHLKDPTKALAQTFVGESEEQAIQRLKQERSRGTKACKKMIKHAVEAHEEAQQRFEQLMDAKRFEKGCKAMLRI